MVYSLKCTVCGSKNHTKKNCPKTSEGVINRMRMYCPKCWSSNHSIEACPRYRGTITRTWSRESVADYYVKD